MRSATPFTFDAKRFNGLKTMARCAVCGAPLTLRHLYTTLNACRSTLCAEHAAEATPIPPSPPTRRTPKRTPGTPSPAASTPDKRHPRAYPSIQARA
jgi:hypothetical protein